MKKYLYLGAFLLACGCSNDGSQGSGHGSLSMPEASELPGDVEGVITYAPINTDTIAEEMRVEIENEVYALHIFSFSKNDSSVVSTYFDGSTAVEHDRAFKILLAKYMEVDLSITLDKNTFRDSLDTDFFKRAGLYAVDYNAVRSNALYLEAYIGVPESDNVQRFEVQWIFRGPQAGIVRFHYLEDEDPY